MATSHAARVYQEHIELLELEAPDGYKRAFGIATADRAAADTKNELANTGISSYNSIAEYKAYKKAKKAAKKKQLKNLKINNVCIIYMNYTNPDPKIELFLRRMKVSRIPAYMGSFDSLIARTTRVINPVAFTQELNAAQDRGKQEGFNVGLEKGLKEFVFNGENQLFVDKSDGKVYTFINNAQILNSDKLGPIISDFTAKEALGPYIQTRKENLQDFMNKYLHDRNLSNDGSNDYDEQIGKVQKDLLSREQEIKKTYAQFRDGEKDEDSDLIEQMGQKVKAQLRIIGSLDPTNPNNQNLVNEYDELKSYLHFLENKDNSITSINSYNDFKIKNYTNRMTMSLVKKNKDKTEVNYLSDKSSTFSFFGDELNDFIMNKSYFVSEPSAINQEIEKFKNNKTKVLNAFTDIKNRSTSMMLTDKFNIYNVDQIRKIYPIDTKIPVENDIFAKIHENKISSMDSNNIINTIADYRTNKKKITKQNFYDQILIPQGKVAFPPSFIQVDLTKKDPLLELSATIPSKFKKVMTESEISTKTFNVNRKRNISF